MKITDSKIKKGLDEAYKEAGQNAYFGNGFYAGIRFVLQHQELNWTAINKDTLKIGVNEFYYVLENNLAVELKIYKYVP